MTDQSAGPALDALGVTLDIGDNQQITEAVVVAKCVDFENGTVGLVLATSSELDWVAQRGLISTALYILDQDEFEADG